MIAMIKSLRNIVVISGLVLAFMMPTMAVALEQMDSVTATVQVVKVESLTVDDHLPMGLSFGNLVPGAGDKAEISQGDNGSLIIRAGVENNVDFYINTKGGDFVSGTDIMTVDNVRWNTENDTSTATSMAEQYATIGTLPPGGSQVIWHWLSIPGAQEPGVYTSVFYFQSQSI